MILADPLQYRTWQEWARAFVGSMTKQTPREVTKLVPYTVGTLPPANEDGMVVFVTDDAQGAVPVFSYNGEWLRTTDRIKTTVDITVTVPLVAFTCLHDTPTVTIT